MTKGRKIAFALNHMAAPSLGFGAFIDLAAALGCVGVEFRNDLTDRALFDGAPPRDVGKAARDAGIRILALAEVKRFNDRLRERRDQAKALIDTAVECGAEAVSLIPVNAADFRPDPAEGARLVRDSLDDLAPLIRAAGLKGLVEPLGFPISSLRTKRAALDAIDAAGGGDVYRLVHDTFHHALAGETEMFAGRTGIVHVSGVADPAPALDEMRDGDRVLVDAADRLGNVGQIAALAADGYGGPVSFEPFAASVHALADPAPALAASIEFIEGRLVAQAA